MGVSGANGVATGVKGEPGVAQDSTDVLANAALSANATDGQLQTGGVPGAITTPSVLGFPTASSLDPLQHQRRQHVAALTAMFHATNCPNPVGCAPVCTQYKQLLAHIRTCNQPACNPACVSNRNLMAHYKNCVAPDCVCASFRQQVQEAAQRRKAAVCVV